MTPPLLSVRGVKAFYGHIAALRGVDVDVGEGEIVALIGARQIFVAIKRLISEEKLTVFLVEQTAVHVLKPAQQGDVIVNGRITLSGSGRELLARPEVKAAYLEGGRH